MKNLDSAIKDLIKKSKAIEQQQKNYKMSDKKWGTLDRKMKNINNGIAELVRMQEGRYPYN